MNFSTVESGVESYARLCNMIMESNTGVAQQIIENRHDLLDLLTIDQLTEPDDLGLNCAFLAIYYDRPEMVRYLHGRGIDFSIPCDPMNFGTPMFYAVCYGRHDLVKVLDSIGISVTTVCDSLEQKPIFHADRIDDKEMKYLVGRLSDKQGLAILLCRKNLWKIKARKQYLLCRKAIMNIQRIIRGFLGRRRCKKRRVKQKLKAQFGAEFVDDDESQRSESGSLVDNVTTKGAGAGGVQHPGPNEDSEDEDEKEIDMDEFDDEDV